MKHWETVKIGSFLKERTERYKPEEANKLGYKRLDKIDFSGNIHISDGKETRTDMILVKNGDLVISGINVEKGAVAVYKGEDDILATIHYSSYEFDQSKINIDYFKWFLKSKAFQNVIKTQVRGGIKTELKPQKFLPLQIELPDIETQQEIENKIHNFIQQFDRIETINASNYDLVNQLRQSILQEAVQGKLVPQDPNDEPASELIKKIKAEKEKLIKEGKIRKEEALPPIKENEIPYELPKGWEWVRLTNIGEINPRNYAEDDIDTSFIPMPLISDKYSVLPKYEIRKWSEIKKGFTHFQEGDVAVAKITPCFENSKACVMRNLINGIGAGTTELHVFRGTSTFILPEYVYIYFKSPKFIEDGKRKMTGTAGQQSWIKNIKTNAYFKK
ncbi:TPA: restriction endonuclease subunit S [bacterium]|nr:restriction endonuclease subunit S [bacterium]